MRSLYYRTHVRIAPHPSPRLCALPGGLPLRPRPPRVARHLVGRPPAAHARRAAGRDAVVDRGRCLWRRCAVPRRGDRAREPPRERADRPRRAPGAPVSALRVLHGGGEGGVAPWTGRLVPLDLVEA